MKDFFETSAEAFFDKMTDEEFVELMSSVGFKLEDDVQDANLSFSIPGRFSTKKQVISYSKVSYTSLSSAS